MPQKQKRSLTTKEKEKAMKTKIKRRESSIVCEELFENLKNISDKSLVFEIMEKIILALVTKNHEIIKPISKKIDGYLQTSDIRGEKINIYRYVGMTIDMITMYLETGTLWKMDADQIMMEKEDANPTKRRIADIKRLIADIKRKFKKIPDQKFASEILGLIDLFKKTRDLKIIDDILGKIKIFKEKNETMHIKKRVSWYNYFITNRACLFCKAGISFLPILLDKQGTKNKNEENG